MTFRWNWGVGVSAVYVVFAIGTSAVVAFSMRQHVDLVSDDYYDKAIALDEHRAAQARAAALGAAFAITSDGREVVVTWPSGMAIESGTVTMYRPSDAMWDRHVAASPDRDGRQTLPLAGFAAGRWTAQVEWRAGGQTYYAEHDVVVPGLK